MAQVGIEVTVQTLADALALKVPTSRSLTINGTSHDLSADQTWTVTAVPSGSAGGDLTGTYPNPTLAAVVSAAGPIGSATVVPIVTTDAKGRVTALTSTTITGVVPGGSAGGDLTGTYPNPTLAFSVAKVKATVSLTAQTADIADTNFSGANVAGLYRVEVYLVTTTADGAAGDVTAHIKYTDAAGARDQTVGAVLLPGTGFAQATFFVQLASGSVAYSTSHSGIFGTAAYALYASCERIV